MQVRDLGDNRMAGARRPHATWLRAVVAAGLLAADQGRAVRQVAFIDRTGAVAAWTGGRDIQHAGHVVGPVAGPAGAAAAAPADAPGLDPKDGLFTAGATFSVQANLMASDRVWPEMARAFQQATGNLADRMLAAMEAAEAAGGDLRGRQSAGLIIVKAEASGRPWADRVFDLRVDDAEDPVRELRRLVGLQRAYNHMNAGDAAMEHQDTEGALREYAAAERLAAGIEGVLPTRLAEMLFWHAVALVNIGRVEESLPLFEKTFAVQPGWRDAVARLPAAGLITADPALIRRIVGLGARKD